METLLISACLLGAKCKYSGGSNALPPETLAALKARYHLIPVCPEVAGGLPVPREPGERQGDRVVSRRFGAGTVVSAEPTRQDTAVTVDFDKYGRKVLLAAFAGFTPEEG